jgi:hypothetical protein
LVALELKGRGMDWVPLLALGVLGHEEGSYFNKHWLID